MIKRRVCVVLAFIIVVMTGLAGIPAQADVHYRQQIAYHTASMTGLVGYWSLDEGNGDIAHNSLSSDDDGIVYNAAWVAGVSGTALHFDGDDDYLEIAHSSNLSVVHQMTLAAWVKPEALCDSNNPIIQMDNSYGLKITSSGQAIGFIWSGFESHHSTTHLIPDTWYHVAATFEDGVHRIFVNGILENQATDPMATIPSAPAPVYFGKGAFGCDFTGIIDEVYIYQTALTPQAIQEIYQTATIPTTPDNLQVEHRTPDSFTLTWNDTSSNEDGFKIYRWDESSQDVGYFASTEANITTFTDTSVQCGRDYGYEVSAYNIQGESAPTSRVTGTSPPCSSSHTVYLPCLLVPEIDIPVASVLTPFDANVEDVVGPSDWSGNYGKSPEIIVASDGVELDVLAQDYNPETPWEAVLLHIKPTSTGYTIIQARTDIPFLDRVMGLARDESGNRYYATGVNEGNVVSPTYPPLNTYRNNIVRVIKLNRAGDIEFNIDLDTARHAYDNDAEMIINPMVAASSRLAVGGNELALVHGINTDPDWDIGGARHQKALSTRLDATSGAIMQTSSAWVSHSFDQRLFFDGEEIIEHHLGDAYPRHLVFARNNTSYPLFYIKGELGENNTYTRLGGIARIAGDPDYTHIALFATENTADTGSRINGARNLAIVRVTGDDHSIDPGLPDTLTVSSKGTQYVNRLRWLTQYSSASNIHAERPKIISIGDNQYIVLWEEWRTMNEHTDTFQGVYGMVIDDQGNRLRPATLITDKHHLHRGDDAFFLDNRAAWITGNAVEQKLYIHFVDAALTYEMVPVD